MIPLDDRSLTIMGMSRVMAYLLVGAPIIGCITILVRFAPIILAAIAHEARFFKSLMMELVIPELLKTITLVATLIFVEGSKTLNLVIEILNAELRGLMAPRESLHTSTAPEDTNDLNNNTVVESGMSNASVIGAATVVLFGAAGLMLALNKKTNVTITEIEGFDDIEAQPKSKSQNLKLHLY